MKSSILVAFIAGITLAYIVPQAVHAASPASLNIYLLQHAQPSGSPTYDIQLLGSTQMQTVTSPGGHVFSGAFPTYAGLTEAQVLSEAIGQWTIARPPLIPPGQPPETHAFTLAPFSISSFYTVPPTIISPTNNSLVPASFPVVYAWPPDETPPPTRSSYPTISNQIQSINIELSTASNVAPVDVTFKPGETQGTVQIAIGTANSMASYLSNATPAASNPYWEYSVSMNFFNLSQPLLLTVTSVPEPASLMLIAVVAPCATTFLRRKR